MENVALARRDNEIVLTKRGIDHSLPISPEKIVDWIVQLFLQPVKVGVWRYRFGSFVSDVEHRDGSAALEEAGSQMHAARPGSDYEDAAHVMRWPDRLNRRCLGPKINIPLSKTAAKIMPENAMRKIPSQAGPLEPEVRRLK